ncbi:MAG: SUMF1/EgtB/PvdO family nonheme iron enzyme [Xanthomonadaceae bacterium]|nr:SUMF1/EgtB/PvdO family nonheme iron enzyme [Xanthomonadaceae bacterium]
MKKQIGMTVIAAIIAICGAEAKTTKPVAKKAKVKITKYTKKAARKIANYLDVGIVGPNGEVILFYKDGGNIVIQACEDLTLLKAGSQRQDCKTKAGTKVSQVPVSEFKEHLKMALQVPNGDYSDEMDKKIDLYKKQNQLPHVADLEKQKAAFEKAIAKIQAFIDAEGAEAAGNKVAEKSDLQKKLDAVKAELVSGTDLKSAVKAINDLVDHLVDDLISKSDLTKYSFGKNKESFEFNILRSYVQLSPGISMPFVDIKKGTFQMGSPDSESGRYSDETAHSVTISHDFEIGATEVTQLQWFQVMGTNPSYFSSSSYCADDNIVIGGTSICPNLPVEQVSYNDIKAFLTKFNANKADNYTYRLPTEAEWEYSARSGSQAAYSFGNDASKLGEYAWFSSNLGSRTHEVASKQASSNGTYDMHGNVWEWVEDAYGDYSKGSVTDPLASSGSDRVVRGGGWNGSARGLRSARRRSLSPGVRWCGVGFRLLRTQ